MYPLLTRGIENTILLSTLIIKEGHMRLHPGDYWAFVILGLMAIGFGFLIIRSMRKPRVDASSEEPKK